MSEIAILGWGICIGWLVSTWRIRKPSSEEVIGSYIIRSGRLAISRSRFIGPGFRAVNTATLTIDGKPLSLEIVAEGK